MKRSLILIKTEVTYGIDPNPSAGTDALLVSDLKLSWPVEVVDREVLDGSLSPFRPLHARKFAVMEFIVEMKGSGAAGTGSDWDAALLSCGFSVTTVASTSDTYDPVSTSLDSCTIYAYRDGLKYELNGGRGNVKFDFPAGKVATMTFTFTGHAVAPIDSALPSPTVDSTVPKVVKNSSFVIGSFPAIVSSLELDMQNQVVVPDDINASDGYGEVQIVNRTAQGSFNPEVESVATKDFYAEWTTGLAQSLTIQVGVTSGNILILTAPRIVFRELSEADREGIMTYDLQFTAARNTGDDEVKLVQT